MKIIVDEMPKKEGDCFWSKWYDCPGHPERSCYVCALTNKKCNWSSIGCACLKTIENKQGETV